MDSWTIRLFYVRAFWTFGLLDKGGDAYKQPQEPIKP